MVATPWGESTRLRERMLGGGPRVSAEAAAQNQRERLFGAMVAGCAERGYEATTVSDLVALSGVSRRDFYRHFTDKEGCFLATMEALLGAGEALAGERGDAGAGGLQALICLCSAQPAAARLCLLESFVAGEAAVARMDAAVAQAQTVLEATMQAAGREGMPGEIYAAILGGVREVVGRRLQDGREGEVAELAPALREWAVSYQAPPRRLPRPRPRAGAPGRYLPEDPAERIIAAMTRLVAERGYQATRIEEIVAAAGVSLSTFYAHFDGKAAVLGAALEAGQARLRGVALPPYARHLRSRDWPAAVRAAFEAMFAFFAAEPDYARMAMVEVFAAGADAAALRARMIGALHGFLEPGFERAPDQPPVIAEAIGGATNHLAYEQIRRGGAELVPAQAPLATYLTLAPFLGAEEAASVARGRR